MQDRTASRLLLAGIAVPILYFGMQVIAAPFYPGYSFLANSASQLGSDRSTQPWILNAGAMLTGIATLIASFGFFHGLRRIGTHPIVVWLTWLALVSYGLGGLWAGSFPLPDRRHNPGPLAAVTYLLPVLLPLAFWKSERVHGVRIYLFANLLLFIALVPIMSGIAGINTQGYGGLLQRIAAVVLHLPIAIVAWVLRKEMSSDGVR